MENRSEDNGIFGKIYKEVVNYIAGSGLWEEAFFEFWGLGGEVFI